MRIFLQQFIPKECIILISNTKIHETLVENKSNVIILTPSSYLMDSIYRNEISRRVIWIDEKQVFYSILSKEPYKIIS